MSKKSGLRGRFEKQHGKRTETLLTAPSPYLLTSVKAIYIQKVSVSDIQNFQTVR